MRVDRGQVWRPGLQCHAEGSELSLSFSWGVTRSDVHFRKVGGWWSTAAFFHSFVHFAEISLVHPHSQSVMVQRSLLPRARHSGTFWSVLCHLFFSKCSLQPSPLTSHLLECLRPADWTALDWREGHGGRTLGRGCCHCPGRKSQGHGALVPGADRVKVPSQRAWAHRAVGVPSNLRAQHTPSKTSSSQSNKRGPLS